MAITFWPRSWARSRSVSSLDAGPNEVVGLFPRRVDARVVDVQSTALPDGAAVENAVLRMVRDLPRRVVLNSSTGLKVPLSAAADRSARDQLDHQGAHGGSRWQQPRGQVPARQGGGQRRSVLAALASEVRRRGPARQPRRRAAARRCRTLTNTLLVENVLNTANEPFQPGCRSATSNVGGTIAAVGTAVFSLMDRG